MAVNFCISINFCKVGNGKLTELVKLSKKTQQNLVRIKIYSGKNRQINIYIKSAIVNW